MKLRSDTKDVIKFNGNSLEDQDVYGMNEPLTISSENTGTADVSIDLLGFIPVKNIKVTVVDEKYLIPGGQSIGVMLYTKGALVVGTMDVVTEDGQRVNPALFTDLFFSRFSLFSEFPSSLKRKHAKKSYTDTVHSPLFFSLGSPSLYF